MCRKQIVWAKIRLQSALWLSPACVQDSRLTGSLTYPGPPVRQKGLDLAGTPRQTPPACDSAPRGPRPPSWTAGHRTAGGDRLVEGNTVPAAQKTAVNRLLSITGVSSLSFYFLLLCKWKSSVTSLSAWSVKCRFSALCLDGQHSPCVKRRILTFTTCMKPFHFYFRLEYDSLFLFYFFILFYFDSLQPKF